MERREVKRDITALCMEHPVATLMLAGGFVLLGIISIFRIPVGLLPNTAFPGLTLQTEYSGVDPRKMEEIITRPLEDVVSTVGGIVRLFSVSEEGKSRINLEFERDSDVDLKSLEVRERADLVASAFPREVQKPVILRFDPEQRPIMIIAMESNERELTELREIAERELKKNLEGAKGVSEIIVAGGRVREIRIAVDKISMESHGLSMGHILNALQLRNINSSAGKVDYSGGEFSIYLKGRFRAIESIRKLVLTTGESGGKVRVRDIATVSYEYRKQENASRIDGLERVSLYVHKTGTANLLALSSQIRERLDDAVRRDINFRIVYDQADIIRAAFGNIAIAAGLGLALVSFVLYVLFRSLHNSILATLTIPASLCCTSLVLFLAEQEYNLMTITGFVLSTGVSLLYCILTLAGMSEGGVIRGAAKARSLLVITTLIIAAVFAPLVFSGEDMRVMYGGLSVALICSTASTAILCSTVLPVLVHTSRFPLWKNNRLLTIVRVLVLRRLRQSVRLIESVFSARRGLLLFVYLGVPALALLVFQFVRQEFINPLEGGKVNVHVEFPSGTSFAETNKTTQKIEKALSTVAKIKEVTSRIDPGQASLIVKLSANIRATDKLLAHLKEITGNTKPAFVHFSRESDAQALREITIDVQGEELHVLDKLTRKLAGKAKGLPGVAGVLLRYKSPRPELRILVDKLKAEKVGITTSAAGRYTRLAIEGGVATKFIERNREIDVRIRFLKKFRRTFQDLRKFAVRGADGRLIPLPEISRLVRGTSPVKIYRKDKKRTLSFTIKLKGSNFNKVYENLQTLKQEPLPENYRVRLGRELEKALENRSRFARILISSLILIYMLLAGYFESLTKPFMLLPALPLPISTIVIALFVLRMPLSVPILIGFILLSALIVMHGIALMDRRAEAPISSVKAPYNALTPFVHGTVILGVMFFPLLWVFGQGGQLLRGLALTLIVGMIVSLYFTPVSIGIGTKSIQAFREFAERRSKLRSEPEA